MSGSNQWPEKPGLAIHHKLTAMELGCSLSEDTGTS